MNSGRFPGLMPNKPFAGSATVLILSELNYFLVPPARGIRAANLVGLASQI